MDTHFLGLPFFFLSYFGDCLLLCRMQASLLFGVARVFSLFYPRPSSLDLLDIVSNHGQIYISYSIYP